MNTPLSMSQIGGRFHPATEQQFYGYAKHLAWLIEIQEFEARKMLARIYCYRNIYELEQILKRPATPGPFDDAIPFDILCTERMQHAIAVRNARAVEIITNRLNFHLDGSQPKFTPQQLFALELFSSPLAHNAAFHALAKSKSSVLWEYHTLAP